MKLRHMAFSAIFLSVLILTGCSPALSVKLTPEYNVSMQFQSGTGQELSKTFTALTGQQMGFIQTGPAVTAMKAAGLTATGIQQDGSQFTLTTGPDKVTGILSGCPGAISVQSATPARNSAADGTHVLSFTLSPETAQYIISLLPEETASYTELFMAPLFTGETMSPADYEDLIAAVYGNQLASELAASKFTLSISAPGTITSVSVPAILNASTTKINGNVQIIIPLSSLLTLSDAHSILVFFDKTKYTN